MTRPNIIGFAKEGSRQKLFLRFLLHSTAKRGNLVEGMYVTLASGNETATFPTWGHGDNQENLVRGSGLFVSSEGVVVNHHFVARPHSYLLFKPGVCVLQIYASVVGMRKSQLLYTVEIQIEDVLAQTINGERGVLYDWDPELKQYSPQEFVRSPTFEDLSSFEHRRY